MAFDTQPPRILTASEIWAVEDTPERTIEIPEWNGSVRVRGLTLQQIATVAEKATIRNPRTNAEEQDRGLMAAYTIIEGMVEPKMQIADIGRLRGRAATAITRIVQAISSLGTTEESIRDADKSPGNGLDGPLSIFPRAGTQNDAGRTSETHVIA